MVSRRDLTRSAGLVRAMENNSVFSWDDLRLEMRSRHLYCRVFKSRTMRMGGNLAGTADEPVLVVNIESPRFVEDIQQQTFVIGFGCGQQPLICCCVASRYVNTHMISSIRDILLDAPFSEAIFKRVEAKRRVRGQQMGDVERCR